MPEPTETPVADSPTSQVQSPKSEPVAPAAAPPPAAATVIHGEVTEETLKLRKERDELADKLKRRDTDYSELERTHQEYRNTVEQGTPIPVRKKRRGALGVTIYEDA